MPVKPIPDDYQNVIPYLVVNDAAKLMSFLKKTFDAKEKEVATMPDGTIVHAEVIVGDSVIMMGQARKKSDVTKAMLYVYVKNTDVTYKRALKAGASSILKPVNQFYGDRNAGVKDTFGNQWWIATHVEDVSQEEMIKRMASARGK